MKIKATHVKINSECTWKIRAQNHSRTTCARTCIITVSPCDYSRTISGYYIYSGFE